MNSVLKLIKEWYFLCILIVLGIIIFVVLLGGIKKGTFSIDYEDNSLITIDCPNVSKIGDNVICDVTLKNTEKTILSVNANYDFDDTIEYVSFDVNEDIFELYSVDDDNNESVNGFAVGNIDGVNSEVLVGKLSVKVNDNSLVNTGYKVGLKNIELSDIDYEMIDISDTYDTVRTMNNVATLSNITLSNGNLKESFNSNVYNYTANVSSSTNSLTLSALPTDSNAKVTGDTTKELHYGTNKYTINVVSEDEAVTNTYIVNVFRKYDFNTDVYVYNKDGGYIYTRNDSNDIILANIEKLENNLSYNINNDYLEVLYGNEVLTSMKILNFNSEYTIVNKTIYIPNDLTYSLLSNKITSDDIIIKVVDDDNNEISNTDIINDNNKVEIYYNNNKIDSYDIKVEYLKIDSILIVDNNAMMIKRLTLGTTYGQLLEKINTSGDITLISNDGNILTTDSIVKTGDTISIKLTDATITYKLSVLGDITGNGIVKNGDVGVLYKHFRKRIVLEDEYVAAGDINNDGIVKNSDVGVLYKYYRKKIDSLED